MSDYCCYCVLFACWFCTLHLIATGQICFRSHVHAFLFLFHYICYICFISPWNLFVK